MNKLNKMLINKVRNITLSATTITMLIGCSGSNADTTKKSTPLTDANIAAIVVGANNIDILLVKLP